jgi:hypothetical protein
MLKINELRDKAADLLEETQCSTTGLVIVTHKKAACFRERKGSLDGVEEPLRGPARKESLLEKKWCISL